MLHQLLRLCSGLVPREMEVVRQWLQARQQGDWLDGVVTGKPPRHSSAASSPNSPMLHSSPALRAADFPPRTWVAELSSMERDGALQGFLQAVAKHTHTSIPSAARLGEVLGPVLFRVSEAREHYASRFVELLIAQYDESHWHQATEQQFDF